MKIIILATLGAKPKKAPRMEGLLLKVGIDTDRVSPRSIWTAMIRVSNI